jgi:hypothetical protein
LVHGVEFVEVVVVTAATLTAVVVAVFACPEGPG